MRYKCIIIDDEKPARMLIENYCDKIDFLEVVGSFKSPLNALPLFEKDKIDLVFLDIQMPDISGIDFLKTFQTQHAKVIFTTAYREYALEGYELDVIDYLLKPIPFHRFLKAINKVKESLSPAPITSGTVENNVTSSKTLQLRANKRIYRVPIDDILYIQSENEYVAYHTLSYGKLMIHGALKALENQLIQDSFLRIHRSYIINLTKIHYVEGNQVYLDQTKI